jgi:hypothetical protein
MAAKPKSNARPAQAKAVTARKRKPKTAPLLKRY